MCNWFRKISYVVFTVMFGTISQAWATIYTDYSVLHGGTLNDNVSGTADGVGLLVFGNNQSTIGTANNPLNIGHLNNDPSTFDLDTVLLSANSDVTTFGQIWANRVTIADTSKLTLNGDSDPCSLLCNILHASVDGENEDEGKLKFIKYEAGISLQTLFSITLRDIGANNRLSSVDIIDSNMATVRSINASRITIDTEDLQTTFLKTYSSINADNIELGSGVKLSIGSFSNVFSDETQSPVSSSGSISGLLDGVAEGDGTLEFFAGNNSTISQAIGSINRLSLVLIKENSSITTNAAINVFNISIENGSKLTVGNNGSLNALVDGAAAGAGTLEFDSNTSTISQAIGSSAALGSVNFNGNSNVASNIGINASNIVIDGGSTLTLGTNGSNIGSVTGNVAVDGTLSLGSVGKTIVGNVNVGTGGKIDLDTASHVINGTFTSASQAAIALALNSQAKLQATTFAMNGDTKLQIAGSGGNYVYIPRGTQVRTAILSGSSVTKIDDNDIDFNGSGSNIAGHLEFFTEVVGTDLMLVASRISEDLSISDPSVKNVYDNINQIGAGATGELRNFQQYLDESIDSDDKKIAALRSLLPQNDNGVAVAVRNISNVSSNIAGDRLVSLYKKKTYKLRRAAGDEEVNSGLWGQAFGSSATQDNYASSGAYGYKANSQGFVIGGDSGLGERGHVGISVSYAKSGIEASDKSKNTDIDTYQANIYAGSGFDKVFVNGMAGFAWNEYDSSRTIATQNLSAKGNYSGQTYTAKLETGMAQDLEYGFNIMPTISAIFAHNAVSAYTETNAGTLSLHTDRSSANFFEGRAGMLLSYNTIYKSYRISPNIKASYGYDFIGDEPVLTSNFVGQTASFKTEAPRVYQGSMQIGAGLNIYSSDGFITTLNYSFESRANYKSNSGSIRLRYNF
jgi:uncharacterized protein with beta-barrel porin domain